MLEHLEVDFLSEGQLTFALTKHQLRRVDCLLYIDKAGLEKITKCRYSIALLALLDRSESFDKPLLALNFIHFLPFRCVDSLPFIQLVQVLVELIKRTATTYVLLH